MSHSKITGKIAEQKLDKMIEEAIKAGVRIQESRARLFSADLVSEIIELLQVAYEDLDHESAMAAFEALANHEGDIKDYVEAFLRKANKLG